MKKKIKDLTEKEIWKICEKVPYENDEFRCEKCSLYNSRTHACPRHYLLTLNSKFNNEELNKEVEINESNNEIN